MPRSYPPEFRRKVLDLIAAGRTVAAISADLGVSGQTIYNWRNQDQVDRGERPGVTSTEQAELTSARRRITELETELAATKRANELLKQVVPPKRASRPSPRWLKRVTRPKFPAECSRCLTPGSTHGARAYPRLARSSTRGSPT